MKPLRRLPSGRAFSLVELLVVVAIIGVVASMLLPSIGKGPGHAKQIKCLNNLRQLGIAFHSFANDHEGRFPMAVPMRQGGSLEFVYTGQAFRHVQPLARHVDTPRVLVCPADTRQPAPDWPPLRNRNLSYFIGVTASLTNSMSVLAGDRNVSRVPITGGGQVIINSTAAWTGEMHRLKGNLLFSDGSQHMTTDSKLRDALLSATQVSN